MNLLRSAWLACVLAFPATAALALPGPFTLPVGARIVETSADGKGWKTTGEIAAPYVQAQARLTAKIAAAGWLHVHTIKLDRDRLLDVYRRGGEELTLMIWRVATTQTAFSYGLSRPTAPAPNRAP